MDDVGEGENMQDSEILETNERIATRGHRLAVMQKLIIVEDLAKLVMEYDKEYLLLAFLSAQEVALVSEKSVGHFWSYCLPWESQVPPLAELETFLMHRLDDVCIHTAVQEDHWMTLADASICCRGHIEGQKRYHGMLRLEKEALSLKRSLTPTWSQGACWIPDSDAVIRLSELIGHYTAEMLKSFNAPDLFMAWTLPRKLSS